MSPKDVLKHKIYELARIYYFNGYSDGKGIPREDDTSIIALDELLRYINQYKFEECTLEDFRK